MSFPSSGDREARRRVIDSQRPLPREEIVVNSRQHAHDEIDALLKSLKDAYRSTSTGWTFIFDQSDARRPTMDARVVVEELVRLIQDATDFTCELDSGNSSSRSSFSISF